MAKKQTPLMRQYEQIKKKHPDTVLLFRLGDFFETFEEDAAIAARVCGLTLTKRNNGKSEATPLAGFPHHQLDNYLPKLVRAGYRVSICEQLEDPKQSRGIVRRGVVEVVTPGVAFNDKLLDTKRNNYLAAVAFGTGRSAGMVGLSFADISTAEFSAAEIPADQLGGVLESLQAAEILVAKSDREQAAALLGALSGEPLVTRLEDWLFREEFGRNLLLEHFGTATLKGFGVHDFKPGIAAAGAVLHYIGETQQGGLPHMRRLSAFHPERYMRLDASTRRNLEITLSMHDGSRDGTLVSILDKCMTAMGSRLLKKWITRPLTQHDPIVRRHDAVGDFHAETPLRDAVREQLKQVGDLERLTARICTGRATPRDLGSLASSLRRLPDIIALLQRLAAPALLEQAAELRPMKDTCDMLAQALSDEPPAAVGAGNVFREGYSDELDEYRDALYSGKNWIREYQERQRQATGIPSLKVGFNNVFGYYLEVTHAHKDKIDETWHRKQTLTNAERYITPELKELEDKILGAEEKLADLERHLFGKLRDAVAAQAEDVLHNAQLLAEIDCLQGFAQAASEHNFHRPLLDDSTQLVIKAGRHPVVEQFLPVGESYVPNSTGLDADAEQLHIITGPNMSGKSSYLRQVGLIVLLAQIGSFVPAESAHIGIVDRIFTRVGAQDNITAGESTFLVEMQETANILNNAGKRSLILLDEVGRGTATFDGISIAWSLAEYIHEAVGARTLFATHYHELNALAERFERIVNYKVDVQEVEDKILFTRKVLPGATDHSFGIHVAEMAGLPESVTTRAKEILRRLEADSGIAVEQSEESAGGEDEDVTPTRRAPLPKVKRATPPPGQLTLFEVRDDNLRERIRGLDLNGMTPMQALQTLHELREEIEGGI